MNTNSPGDITILLTEWRNGDVAARDRIFAVAYHEMYAIADRLMRRERPSHTLQPSALVNECVARLLKGASLQQAPNRIVLFVLVTRAMRSVLIDHRRRRYAERREGRWCKHGLTSDSGVADPYSAYEQVDIIDAFEVLAATYERPGVVASLHLLGGYSKPEIAEMLAVSLATVESDWRFARAWLRRQVDADPAAHEFLSAR